MSAPLSQAQRAQIQENIEAAKAIPGAVDFFKEFHAAGLVDGWRDIHYVGPIRPTNPKAIEPVILESFEDIMKRNKNGTAR